MRAMKFVTGMLVFGVAVGARAAEADSVKWRHDFNAAASEAQLQKKPLFITVGTEWCGPCKEMHRTTFRDPALVDLLNKRCIPLHLDGDKNKERMNEWRVAAYPTHMIVGTVGSVRTQVLERIEGRIGASEMIEAVQRAVKKQGGAAPSTATKSGGRAEGPLQPPSPSEAESPVKPASFKTPSKREMESADAPTLALGGHCPVCMIERAEMTPGKKSEEAVYNGKLYLFSSAENRKRFLASPAKFLPAANGDCVVSFAESGKRKPGDVKFPAMFEDRVYFLANKESREKFLKSPEAYIDVKGQPKARKAPVGGFEP